MLSRAAKAAFYAGAGPLMRLNGVLYRKCRSRSRTTDKVHLGPGQTHYIEGWLNLDANIFTSRADVWVDLRNPLPFEDASLTALYSHHVVEHLPDLAAHFREAARCLRKGGVYRVGGPNGDSAMRKFLDGDLEWFGTFPKARRSIGGRLDNFIFCAGEHQTLLTASFLGELMTEAGFETVKVELPAHTTAYPEIFSPCLSHESEADLENPKTLIVEAVRG